MLSVGLTSWLASRKDMPVPSPLKTWAMVVAVTRSSGGNQALEMARGALPTCTVQYITVCTVQCTLPTTMLDIPLRMEQTWQLTVNREWLGSWM